MRFGHRTCSGRRSLHLIDVEAPITNADGSDLSNASVPGRIRFFRPPKWDRTHTPSRCSPKRFQQLRDVGTLGSRMTRIAGFIARRTRMSFYGAAYAFSPRPFRFGMQTSSRAANRSVRSQRKFPINQNPAAQGTDQQANTMPRPPQLRPRVPGRRPSPPVRSTSKGFEDFSAAG